MSAGYSTIRAVYEEAKTIYPEHFSPDFLACRLQVSNALVHTALQDLKHRGLIEKKGRAKYIFLNKGEEHYDDSKKSFVFKKFPVMLLPIERFIYNLNHQSKVRSEKKGITHNLTDEHILKCWEECDGKCVLSGVPMTTIRGNGWQVPTNASIDRIDQSMGYVEGNVRLICWQANQMRGRLTDDELLIFCKLIFYKRNGENRDETA